VNGVVTIESVEPFEWIELFSSDNKLLLHQINTSNSVSIQILFDKIKPGVYFLRIGIDKYTSTKKIVVVGN
jgi:hypothetical protein